MGICVRANHKILKINYFDLEPGSSILTVNGLLLQSSVIVLSGADPLGIDEINILSLIAKPVEHKTSSK